MNHRRYPQAPSDMVQPMNMFTDIGLSAVVTRHEAGLLWGKALTTIDFALLKGRIKGRKSLGGGTVLITVSSLAALYGPPIDLTLWECFVGPAEMTTQDALEVVSKKEIW